jgi:hypothetical protein
MARVYADVNANMPRSYWDYDSVNISWGVLENYEVVRKIGAYFVLATATREHPLQLPYHDLVTNIQYTHTYTDQYR